MNVVTKIALRMSLATMALSLAPMVATGADSAGKPLAIGSPAEVVSTHCTKTAGTPSHVVIRLNGLGDVIYAGRHLTTVALKQVMGETDTNHQIFAFCE